MEDPVTNPEYRVCDVCHLPKHRFNFSRRDVGSEVKTCIECSRPKVKPAMKQKEKKGTQ